MHPLLVWAGREALLLAKLVGWFAAGVFLRRMPESFWHDLRLLFAGLIPANLFRRANMSVSIPAPLTSVDGVVERVNKSGVCLGGTWYDYGRTFRGERLAKEVVGSEITLVLVESKDGKKFVRSVSIGSEGTVPEEGGPIERPASSEALKYAEDLALKTGISSEALAQIVRLRFGKSFDALTMREASRTIVFFGGYHRSAEK